MHINSYDLETDLSRCLTVQDVDRLSEQIENAITYLKNLQEKIPAAREHVKNDITFRYFIRVWKHGSKKGYEYRDTDENFNVIPGTLKGSHFAISVSVYTFDKGECIRFEQFDPPLSRDFHFRKVDLFERYLAKLEKDLGVQCKPAAMDPEVRNGDCIFVCERITGYKSKSSPWQCCN